MILITGGLGYLGGRIAAGLLRSGWPVRLGTHRANPIIPPVLQSSDLAVLDLNAVPSLRAAVRGADAVIHLAALNADQCARDPERAILVNTLGTFNLVRAALDEGVDHMIYFSTAHVYGAPLRGTIDELSVPRPTHPYSITHRSAEDFVLQSNDCGIFSGTVLRLSNAVGPPASVHADCWHLLANDLSRQAVESNEIVLRSSGRQQRNFVAIADIIPFIEVILKSTQGEFAGHIINLGGPQSFTILELAQMIRDRSEPILGRTPALRVPQAADDRSVDELFFCVHKARQLGFSPTTDIRTALDATLAWCQEHFSK